MFLATYILVLSPTTLELLIGAQVCNYSEKERARTGNINKQRPKNKNTTIISNLLVVTSQLSVQSVVCFCKTYEKNRLCWSQKGVIKSLATKIRVIAKCTLFGSEKKLCCRTK